MKIKTIYCLLFILFPSIAFASSSTCRLSDGINVNTSKHLLTICKHGSIIKSFKVALGYKGIGKKKAGDNKTPVGLYGLAQPRKSNQFKTFIPILYPTSKQRATGYTGRDVGIHGPTQSSNVFGWLSHLPFATRGCVAVGSNNQIDYVANWLKANSDAKRILII